MNKNIAIILHNMGGPASLDEIKPFLYNLFQDRDLIPFPIKIFQKIFAYFISRIRTSKISKHYNKIGNGSPILKLTCDQKNALEKLLIKKGFNCKVYVAMRYTHPFISEVVKNIKNQSCDYIINCPLYPQYSSTTTGSSFNEFKRIIKLKNCLIPSFYINHWYDYIFYIQALVIHIKKKLKFFSNLNNLNLVFSAHSLPVTVIQKGDPYEKQINHTVNLVLKDLNLQCSYYLCYQSKIGPIKWLRPSTKETIIKIAKKPNQDILIIPISFVSDHYETNYEIDLEYKELAQKYGIRHFKRIDSLNTSQPFIKALTELLIKKIKDEKLDE